MRNKYRNILSLPKLLIKKKKIDSQTTPLITDKKDTIESTEGNCKIVYNNNKGSVNNLNNMFNKLFTKEYCKYNNISKKELKFISILFNFEPIKKYYGTTDIICEAKNIKKYTNCEFRDSIGIIPITNYIDKHYLLFLIRKIYKNKLTQAKIDESSDNYDYYDINIWLLCYTGDSVKKNPYAQYFENPFKNNERDILYNIRYIITSYICPDNLKLVCFDYDKLVINNKKYYKDFIEG